MNQIGNVALTGKHVPNKELSILDVALATSPSNGAEPHFSPNTNSWATRDAKYGAV